MSYQELYEDRDREQQAKFDAELAAEMTRNEAQTPVWCKAITLNDFGVMCGMDTEAFEFTEMVEAAADWFRSGWTTPEKIADWLWAYSQTTRDKQWSKLSWQANPFGEDVLVLIDAGDDEPPRDSRRLHFVRRWSHGKGHTVLSRSA